MSSCAFRDHDSGFTCLTGAPVQLTVVLGYNGVKNFVGLFMGLFVSGRVAHDGVISRSEVDEGHDVWKKDMYDSLQTS